MNTGIIAGIKGFAPLIFYIVGIFAVFVAMTGKKQWPLLFMIGLLPLRNVVEKLHHFPLGKDLIDMLIIALIVGWAFRSFGKKDKFFEKSPINTIIVFLIFYTFISLLLGSMYLNEFLIMNFASPRVQSWKNFCILPLLFFITFNTIKTKKEAWQVVLVICLSIAFMDNYVLRQLSAFQSLDSRAKIHGTFVYLGPNEVAAFYNQITIVLMGICFFLRKSWSKILLTILIVMNLFCVVFLFSRAAYVAITVGMFFLFATKKKILLIPLLLTFICWQTVLPERVKERIEMTTDDYGELDKSSAGRLDVWKESLDLFMENPITGVGYGVFRSLGFRLGDTHNVYVKILVEQGLVGMFIFLLLLFTLFKQGIRLYLNGDDPPSRGLGLGFAIAIIVLAINNFFGDRWTYIEVSCYMWIFAGLVARLNIISLRADQEQPNQRKKTGIVQEINARSRT